jgi:uncharacterized membrane protein
MAFCSACGAQIPEGSTVCPACSRSSAGAGAQPVAGGLADNVAGMLAYVTIVPAIIFLVMAPYNQSRFVRFHSFQSIFFVVAWTVLWIGMSIVGMIPVLGWATILVWPLLGLGGLIIWVILLLKANQGQMFKLPVIGDLAEKQAAVAVPAS